MSGLSLRLSKITITFYLLFFPKRYAKYDALLITSMGQKNTKNSGINGNRDNGNAPPEVSFDDFEVLRAIGRGAFGKVYLKSYQIIIY